MALLAAGYITVAEAADALELHRSTVYRRCKRRGIDPETARAQYLTKWITRASRSGWRPPNKQALRAKGHQAVIEWKTTKLQKKHIRSLP
jgi:hypothetical protein